MAAYVQFMEAAGARVVPLVVGETWDITFDKISRLDGILFPGGDGDYVEYGKAIFEQVKEWNDQGHFYPLWGTCVGYENMAIWVADEGPDVLSVIESYNVNLPLEFIGEPNNNRMFGDLGIQAYGW
jgi:glutamine amidotransferase PdxT